MSGEATTKVKIIETQFIETDASSFKSVVQSLTGKDLPPASRSSSAKNKSQMSKSQSQSSLQQKPSHATHAREDEAVTNLDELLRFLER
ncbi:hypothetical protein Cni_G08562 [Canna indica]|uniref:VQ domain-containing protein n=1 Tax=Canna indica TaxID=4628 RepID=A0AAQ3Q816_9LILI|nr:hypothetical protein Cni_G08562 [Canna indica]